MSVPPLHCTHATRPQQPRPIHPTARPPHHDAVDVAAGVVRVHVVALQVAELDQLVHAQAQQRRLRAEGWGRCVVGEGQWRSRACSGSRSKGCGSGRVRRERFAVLRLA